MKKNIFFVIAVLSITFASIQVNLCFSEKGSHGENTIKENVSLKILDVLSEGDSIKIKANLEDKNNEQEYEKEYYGSSTIDSLSDFYILVNGEWKKLYFDSPTSYGGFSVMTTLTGYYNKELTFVLDEYYDSNKLSHPVNGHFKLEYCGYEAEFDINNNILSNASDKNNLDNDLNNASGEVLNNIGMKYLLGDGVEKDYNLSKQYFEMAAAKGFTNSLNNLAVMIIDGKISGTKEQVRQYLEIAGANGMAGAYCNLGRYILFNVLEGTLGESVFYFEKAAEMGDEEAKNVIKNDFDKLASLDYNLMSADELLDTGYFYYWGGFTSVTIKCWETAASKGSVEALRKLGDLYSNYDTVTLEQLIDIEEAKHNYIEAATLGDEHSQKRLEQLGVRYY